MVGDILDSCGGAPSRACLVCSLFRRGSERESERENDGTQIGGGLFDPLRLHVCTGHPTGGARGLRGLRAFPHRFFPVLDSAWKRVVDARRSVRRPRPRWTAKNGHTKLYLAKIHRWPHREAPPWLVHVPIDCYSSACLQPPPASSLCPHPPTDCTPVGGARRRGRGGGGGFTAADERRRAAAPTGGPHGGAPPRCDGGGGGR